MRAPLIALTTLIALGACAPAAQETMPQTAAETPAQAETQIISAAVAPNTGKAVYEISWQLDTAGAPVSIEASEAPHFAPGTGKIIAENVTDNHFTWNSESPLTRHYFLIIPANGEAVRISNRLLPLEGGRNFRDMGGYQTTDGKFVQWGKIYRSGVMNKLTASDYDYLSNLGIRVICDLRAAHERASEPTNWMNANVAEYLSFPDPEGAGDMGLAAIFQSPDFTPEKVADAMAASYSQIAREQSPAYREMFARLAAGEAPLAFNCSAGKDRAGIGAALILTALGVPRETVLQDYALSETYVDYMKEFSEAPTADTEDSPFAFLMQLPPEVLAPLLRSDPRYLETAFADFEAEHGSVLNFIQQELGVSDAMLADMRQNLLESSPQ